MVARTLRPLHVLLSVLVTGRPAASQFLIAVKTMWLAFAGCALLQALIASSYGDAGLEAWAPVAFTCTVVALLTITRLVDRPGVPHAALVLAVLGVGATPWIGASGSDGQLATTSMLLFVWPALVGAYFLPLRGAMALVALITGLVALGLTSGGGEASVVRVATAALVFGSAAPLVSIARLRTELSIRYLHEASIRDALTGLLNRRGLEGELACMIQQARSTDRPVALLMADIDYFKVVNDRHGHAAGDQVLMEIGTLLHLRAPHDAVVARVGGEEFAIALPDMGFDDAFAVAEEIRHAIGASFKRSATKVTLSMGVVASDRHSLDLEELMTQAVQALYAAKTLGRNRAVGYSDDVLDVLERARIREEEASRNQLATLLTLAEALDLRDRSTAMHSHTVADYAEGMAIELGLDHELVERVRLAGLLHDIGKIGVPDSVLLHPGKLDDEQWALMRQHPEIGARMLNHADYTDIRDWVLAHHERIDGKGYPAALAGDEIPLAARILAIADSYEAMTADRVYRAAPGHAFARSQLQECSGTQFDGDVVAAMIRFLDARGIGREELEPAAPSNVRSLTSVDATAAVADDEQLAA